MFYLCGVVGAADGVDTARVHGVAITAADGADSVVVDSLVWVVVLVEQAQGARVRVLVLVLEELEVRVERVRVLEDQELEELEDQELEDQEDQELEEARLPLVHKVSFLGRMDTAFSIIVLTVLLLFLILFLQQQMYPVAFGHNPHPPMDPHWWGYGWRPWWTHQRPVKGYTVDVLRAK